MATDYSTLLTGPSPALEIAFIQDLVFLRETGKPFVESVVFSSQDLLIDGQTYSEQEFSDSSSFSDPELADSGSLPYQDFPSNSLLIIENGGATDEYDRVTSAIVWLNGERILAPKDFKQATARFEIPVFLDAHNQLDVELRSRPGSALVINPSR